MGSKHETGSRPFRNIHIDYNKYKEDDKEIRLMYERVKKDYLKNRKLDITLEKIYLEERFVQYKGYTRMYYFNILIMILAAFMGGMFSEYFKKPLLAFMAFFLLILLVIKAFKYLDEKRASKEEYEHKYYNISLQVLDEIQREKNDIEAG